jgi:hypothetical protein
MTTRRVAQALSLGTIVVASFLLAVYANAQVEQGRFVGRKGFETTTSSNIEARWRDLRFPFPAFTHAL